MNDKLNELEKDVNKILETYKKKNSNYGDSFTKTIDELGEIAGLVPLYNKIHRATSLIKNGGNNFESIEDTLLDLATYALMLDADIKTRNKDNTKKEVADEKIIPNEKQIQTGTMLLNETDSLDNKEAIDYAYSSKNMVDLLCRVSCPNLIDDSIIPLSEPITDYEEN